MGTKGYVTYLLCGKVGIIPVVQSTLLVHIFVSKIDWLVFNANFSNSSAISWRVFVSYITYCHMYNYNKVQLDELCPGNLLCNIRYSFYSTPLYLDRLPAEWYCWLHIYHKQLNQRHSLL